MKWGSGKSDGCKSLTGRVKEKASAGSGEVKSNLVRNAQRKLISSSIYPCQVGVAEEQKSSVVVV